MPAPASLVGETSAYWAVSATISAVSAAATSTAPATVTWPAPDANETVACAPLEIMFEATIIAAAMPPAPMIAPGAEVASLDCWASIVASSSAVTLSAPATLSGVPVIVALASVACSPL